MWTSPLIVGVLAGLGSALLFASATTGTPLAALLFYAAPLPLFVAGLGFGPLALAIAAAGAVAAIFVALGSWVAIVFTVSVAFPVVVLARLPSLNRPSEAGVEWYPVGRIIIWAAVLGALVVAATIPMVGIGDEGYRAELTRLLAGLLESGGGAALIPEGVEVARVASVLATVLPSAAAAMWMITTLINLWLAVRVAGTSGRLA